MANPNPSPETRFGKGNHGGGKTAAQKAAEYAAAEKAAVLRDKILSVIMERVDSGADVLDFLSSDVLRLFKDSEDRAFGSPKAEVEAKIDASVNVSADATFLDIASRMERLAARASGCNHGEDGVAGDGQA